MRHGAARRNVASLPSGWKWAHRAPTYDFPGTGSCWLVAINERTMKETGWESKKFSSFNEAQDAAIGILTYLIPVTHLIVVTKMEQEEVALREIYADDVGKIYWQDL
ncbi:MAG: hypothetical protein WC683_02830 [bacterium]